MLLHNRPGWRSLLVVVKRHHLLPYRNRNTSNLKSVRRRDDLRMVKLGKLADSIGREIFALLRPCSVNQFQLAMHLLALFNRDLPCQITPHGGRFNGCLPASVGVHGSEASSESLRPLFAHDRDAEHPVARSAAGSLPSQEAKSAHQSLTRLLRGLGPHCVRFESLRPLCL